MYPKRLYAATGGSVTVNDIHHEKSLGPGWSENARPEPEVKTAPLEPEAKKTRVSRVEKAAAAPEPEV